MLKNKTSVKAVIRRGDRTSLKSGLIKLTQSLRIKIFPTRLRAYGVGMGSATQWLFNFVITRITPAAINHIGWRTFIMFGVFCLAMGTWIFFFVEETKGRTLEDMDILFGTIDMERRKNDIEHMIAKAAIVEDEDIAKVDNG
ncbi:hypothetical protein V490_00360 [Pseudogymnoascus sp. VKM F-3557]|nr:hypothetical protein V490_00360 [Pseudogymnoascus sp. VKM F-3557]